MRHPRICGHSLFPLYVFRTLLPPGVLFSSCNTQLGGKGQIITEQGSVAPYKKLLPFSFYSSNSPLPSALSSNSGSNFILLSIFLIAPYNQLLPPCLSSLPLLPSSIYFPMLLLIPFDPCKFWYPLDPHFAFHSHLCQSIPQSLHLHPLSSFSTSTLSHFLLH